MKKSKVFDMFLNLFQSREKKLEQARKELIHNLESNGIRNLVQQMGCREPYSKLILDKQKKENSYSSKDEIWSYAIGVANKLESPELIEELKLLLTVQSFEEKREYVYYCLSRICVNSKNYELLSYLLTQLEKETSEDVIVSLLSPLDEIEKPTTINISIIKKLVMEGTQRIRDVAIDALAFSNDHEAEDLLLILFGRGDSHSKAMICKPLESVGTLQSITILNQAYIKTRDNFLKYSINKTLNSINKRGYYLNK
jgi:hypothetical protein